MTGGYASLLLRIDPKIGSNDVKITGTSPSADKAMGASQPEGATRLRMDNAPIVLSERTSNALNVLNKKRPTCWSASILLILVYYLSIIPEPIVPFLNISV